ncbi:MULTISPECIES: HAD family hydrolase [Neobacillus]|uniref:HAD family hydrolase n=1 Tax=Neobacillus rhizophilus TaxID=2833579 RepID=A0A942UAF4_9BACI|nr:MULTISPECIES: HAD family hydrolase [Neobacillus]MBS4213774.1 HAD family hydrolase [Neobacillus rhizophilus]
MKAIIFDFDGLIVDTETIWFEAYKEVLEKGYGINLTLQQFSKVIGTDDTELFAYIQENLSTPINSEVIENSVKQIVLEKMKEPAAREGVEEYLKEAKELGLKIGLATSSSREWVEGFLKKLHIFKYFNVIKTRDDVSKVKPNPELYIQAVKALGIKPSEAVAFEDSLNGLRAAREAGIHCVVVPNQVTSHLEFHGHSHRLSSMEEINLKQLLQKIKGGNE